MARIAIIGPTHPWPGGISHHTTWLAHRLADRGHVVAVISWSAQYPRILYKAEELPIDAPDVLPFPRTIRPLAWNRPWTWLAAGRLVRSADLVVVVSATPYHAVPYRCILMAAGGRPRKVALLHNVLPHESGPLDRFLTRSLIRAADTVVVHGESQREQALSLGGRTEQVLAVPIPPHPPARDPLRPAATTVGPMPDDREPQLLFFGVVRHYKGLDLLLRALASVPGARLLVAGQFWEDVGIYRALITELGLTTRVELRPGYVSADHIDELFDDSSAMVLPYRSATASQMVDMAFRHGRPVLVTDVGELACGVIDGVDGVVVPAATVDALEVGLRRLIAPGALRLMAEAVPSDDRTDEAWKRYLDVIECALRR